MASSPTARALEYCRQQGWTAGVVERHNSYSGKKHDFLGCIDMIVLDGGTPLGVQVTSGSNAAARMTKARAEPRLQKWLASGARFEVWAWRKVAAYRKDGSRAARDRWDLRRVPYVP